jgi:hypothetical protein
MKPLTNVEINYTDTFSTDIEGEVNDVIVDGHSVATLKALEESLMGELRVMKRTVWVLSSLATVLGVIAVLFMFGLNSARKSDTVMMTETNSRVRYMIDVKPGAREYRPYQEYMVPVIVK